MTSPLAVSGMNDLLPDEAARVRALESLFFSLAGRAGFREVRTPLCEHTELFDRAVGDGTDIVDKEMYTFVDRGGRSLSLRPEGTASLARAALEHSVLEREPVVRWCYAGPMFRAERPARGRFRQFHQVGAEVYGDDSAACDAEVIDLAVSVVRALDVGSFVVRLNSLGSRATRVRYREALVAHFTPHREALSPESQARLARNPLRILDSKDPRDAALRQDAPRLVDLLDDVDRGHFQRVRTFLDALGVPYEVDPFLVRGLDYYTRTVFEVMSTSGALGAQTALGAGGRYDGLFAELRGAPVRAPAVGFALGVERLLLAAAAPTRPVPFSVSVVAAAREDDTMIHLAALTLAQDLRTAGVVAHVDSRFGSIRSQMRQADAQHARLALLIGSNEFAQDTVTVRDMTSHTQSTVPRADVVAYVVALART